MMYFKTLKKDPATGSDLWTYEKRDPSLFTVEGLIRDMMLADNYAEVDEAEYNEHVAEGTEGRAQELGEAAESTDQTTEPSEPAQE